MKYNQLHVSSNKKAKRAGRGISAGRGKTAGRGTKGQRSRTGSGKRPGFEGGQNPLLSRIPKLPGFTSIRPKAENVYTGQLDDIKAKQIDNFTLADAGLVSSAYVNVKLITKGEVKKKHDIHLQGASKSAIEAVQKAGGTFSKVARVKRTKKEIKQ